MISTTSISPTSKLISIAGQVGHDPATKSTPSGLGPQIEVALSNLATCLRAAGATKTDIISVRQYVVDMLPQDPVRAKLYTEWMEGHMPPSTLIGVQSLATKELLYEIEVLVIVSQGR